MLNNPMTIMQKLMQRSNGNPQMLVEQLLRKNPQFARAIQGQNPEMLAKQIMQKNNVDINQIMSMFK